MNDPSRSRSSPGQKKINNKIVVKGAHHFRMCGMRWISTRANERGRNKKRQRRFHLARQTFRRDSRPIGLIHPAAWRPFVFRLVNLSTKNSLPLHCVLFHGSTTIGKKKKIAKNLCYSKALHSRVVREKTQSARHQKNLRVSPLKTSFYSKKRTSYEGKKC